MKAKIQKNIYSINITFSSSTLSQTARVTRMTATAIYHILTNSFIGRNFKTANESIESFKEILFESDWHQGLS